MIEITREILDEIEKNKYRNKKSRKTLKECVGWVGVWTKEERQEIRDAIQEAENR